MSNDLISFLVSKKLIADYSKFLDWILDDKRIERLGKTSKARFIKKIKKLEGIGTDNYHCCNSKEIALLFKKKKDGIVILFSKNAAESSDFLRHIRNSIAHKHLFVCTHKNDYYIESSDFSRGKQTSYICMPLGYLLKIFNIYECIKKEWGNE